MKSYTNLFDKICAFENLYLASRKAEKGKRFRHDVAIFNARRAENLLEIQQSLYAGNYPFGKFHTFKILRPKPRMISAAPYAERVVHHALMNVIAPLLERKFIHDSYANRENKGTSAALDRCTFYARRYRYVLQLDIRKYFPSIDHQLLLAEISRTIRCRQTLILIEQIINASNLQEPANFYFPGDDMFTPLERRKGLPIGNLTSQFFANVYLNPYDHFIKEELGAPGYVRYVDDILIFSDDRAWLLECKRRSQSFLQKWRLHLHSQKALVHPVQHGIPFLGFRLFPAHRRLLRSGIKRARKKLQALTKGYGCGKISWNAVNASVQAWLGHVSQGDTWGLRRSLFEQYAFIRRNP
ncbi:MAG: RNA-directed DNA polymerase [Calditrichaceae bacterium]|nr:RNA-directed DNA polymerase [Calditrichia bacterium]NUQ40795.1 RNA-directed DNA polymerase [Calditrichaceae bacterium]